MECSNCGMTYEGQYCLNCLGTCYVPLVLVAERPAPVAPTALNCRDRGGSCNCKEGQCWLDQQALAAPLSLVLEVVELSDMICPKGGKCLNSAGCLHGGCIRR